MSYTQTETCKTCEYWKDSYEGCYMNRGGFCPDFKKAYRPLYSILESKLTTTEQKLAKAIEALEDFKDHGTRHDINPTGKFLPCGCFDSFQGDKWQGYIRSQDESVRERAREALREIGEIK